MLLLTKPQRILNKQKRIGKEEQIVEHPRQKYDSRHWNGAEEWKKKILSGSFRRNTCDDGEAEDRHEAKTSGQHFRSSIPTRLNGKALRLLELIRSGPRGGGEREEGHGQGYLLWRCLQVEVCYFLELLTIAICCAAMWFPSTLVVQLLFKSFRFNWINRWIQFTRLHLRFIIIFFFFFFKFIFKDFFFFRD